MKVTYTFTVLRYVHDVTTGEFANVGVALYSPETRYVGAICTTRYRRVSRMFFSIDATDFRSLMRFIQGRFEEQNERLREQLLFESLPKTIMEIARGILPPDDSSLQWSEPGGGITEDPRKTLEMLYARMVGRYEKKQKLHGRDDEEIWKQFRAGLERRHVLTHLKPKRIIAKDYDYEFDHARKNEIWHMYEPVSLDLLEPERLLDKANRWFGRVFNLSDSTEKFKLYMLLGEPRDERLGPAFIKAQNILNKMPVEKEFVRESESEAFSLELANEIERHPHDDEDSA
jgi:Protein of unknown function (DUF3037)